MNGRGSHLPRQPRPDHLRHQRRRLLIVRLARNLELDLLELRGILHHPVDVLGEGELLDAERDVLQASSVLGELPRSDLELAVAQLRAAETNVTEDDIDKIGTWTLRTVFDPVSKQGIVFAESLESSDANNAVSVTGSTLAEALEDGKATLCADCGYEFGGDDEEDDNDEEE